MMERWTWDKDPKNYLPYYFHEPFWHDSPRSIDARRIHTSYSRLNCSKKTDLFYIYAAKKLTKTPWRYYIMSHDIKTVMWIRIDRMRIRIHKIWSILVSDLQNIISYKKSPRNLLVKLYFSLNFIPLDPDPRTQMNADPTGSESTSLHKKYNFDPS